MSSACVPTSAAKIAEQAVRTMVRSHQPIGSLFTATMPTCYSAPAALLLRRRESPPRSNQAAQLDALCLQGPLLRERELFALLRNLEWSCFASIAGPDRASFTLSFERVIGF